LKEGRLILEDSIENIKRRYWKRRILIEVDNLGRLLKRLKEDLKPVSLEVRDNNSIILEVNDTSSALRDMPRIIVQEDLILERLELLEPSLEDIFLEVTNGI